MVKRANRRLNPLVMRSVQEAVCSESMDGRVTSMEQGVYKGARREMVPRLQKE